MSSNKSRKATSTTRSCGDKEKMRFFDSEIVREELSEINKLQTSIYGKMFGFGFLSPTDRKEHVDKLETLLEKQKTMWTRLSLSDDPEAKDMKNQLRKSLQGMGFPEGTDMPSIFSAMDDTIGKLKESVD